MTKEEARDLLNALRQGALFPMHQINQALLLTGDLKSLTPTKKFLGQQ